MAEICAFVNTHIGHQSEVERSAQPVKNYIAVP
jgi:hypothetical protein